MRNGGCCVGWGRPGCVACCLPHGCLTLLATDGHACPHMLGRHPQDAAAADKQRYVEEVEAAGPQPKKAKGPKLPHTKVSAGAAAAVLLSLHC